jgi:proteic killer suppression protein
VLFAGNFYFDEMYPFWIHFLSCQNEKNVAIRNFRHKGLRKLFETGDKSGIRSAHAKKIERMLDRLDSAAEVRDMNAPGYDFHPLKGDWKGFYSVHVNGNWTLVFRFEKGEAIDVDLVDYH